MVSYVLLVIAGQTLFLLLYDVLLKKSTFFNSNRVYLLLTFALSLVLPLLRFQVFENTVPTALQITNYTEVASGVVMLDGVTVTAENQMSIWTQFSIWEWIFMTGCLLSLLLFCYKLYTLILLKFKGKYIEHTHFTEVIVPQSNIAFSFFNTMFLGEEVKQKPHAHIVAHELVHMQQKHSWDLLYFEVFRIVFWFNPLVYIYQHRIAELHEFIADSNTSKNHKKEQYQQLLQEVFQTEHISFINQFFNQSLIKKRIVMLQKSKSKKSELVKYALVIPMLAGIMVYTSACNQEETDVITQEENVEVSETVLKQQYLKEIKKEIASGKTLDNLMVDFMKLEDRSDRPSTMEEYCYQSMLLYVLTDKRSNGGDKESVMEGLMHKTYAEYLEGYDAIQKNKAITKVTYLDQDNASAIPFTTVAKKPVFQGCENAADASECFKTKLDAFIVNNFKYPESAKAEGVQGRQYVMFTIAKDGNVRVSGLRGNDERLKQEAKRLIEALPKMIPGEDANGNKVDVTFAYPIVFRI